MVGGFTSATVTHVFYNGDGSAANGTVTATLTGRMTNGGATVLPTEVTATLDASGALSLALLSTQDPATTPTTVQWRLDIRVSGMDPETYLVDIPTGGGTIDLGTLLPGNQQVM